MIFPLVTASNNYSLPRTIDPFQTIRFDAFKGENYRVTAKSWSNPTRGNSRDYYDGGGDDDDGKETNDYHLPF